MRKTDTECSLCEEANYIIRDKEKYCPSCYYVPAEFAEPRRTGDVWEQFWEYRVERAQDGDRLRPVGGFEEAYWGEGEYEYTPTSGFTH